MLMFLFYAALVIVSWFFMPLLLGLVINFIDNLLAMFRPAKEDE